MAFEQRIVCVGNCEAAADLSAKQFHFVKVTAANKVNIATAAGESVLGVLQNKPKAGEAADVMALGITKVKIGVGGLTAGAVYETAADGTAIAVTAAKVGMGTVLSGGNAGEIASVTIGFATGATIAA